MYQECLGTWKAILVDEFQDTSSMQYCLLRILSSHGHVTIVGDEDQVPIANNSYFRIFKHLIYFLKTGYDLLF